MIRQRYPADDPRVAEFAIELASTRGDDRSNWFGSRWRQWPWLIWSGPVPDEGDEEAAANTLVQTWWWRFRAESKVTEIADEEFALYLLTWSDSTTITCGSTGSGSGASWPAAWRAPC